MQMMLDKEEGISKHMHTSTKSIVYEALNVPSTCKHAEKDSTKMKLKKEHSTIKEKKRQRKNSVLSHDKMVPK